MEYDTAIASSLEQQSSKEVAGSFECVAVNEKTEDIIGYAIIKQVIGELAQKFVWLYADIVETVNFLVNKALHDSKMELFHPVGDNCYSGSDAPQPMNSVDAEFLHDAYRMYAKMGS